MRTRLLLLLACVTALGFSQATLTNDSIVKMLKAGLSEDIVLSSIHSQPGKYSTGADDLIALKGAGVSDKIISAMIAGGGTPAAAHLHLARTICRRAERAMVELAAKPDEPVGDAAIQYMNRLSDFLFVASRAANENGAGDVLWVPGQNR